MDGTADTTTAPSVLVQTTSGVDVGRKLVGTTLERLHARMGHPEGDVLVEGLEHPGDEPGGGTGGTDDRQGPDGRSVPSIQRVMATSGRSTTWSECTWVTNRASSSAAMDAGLGQAQDGAPAGVELECDIT